MLRRITAMAAALILLLAGCNSAVNHDAIQEDTNSASYETPHGIIISNEHGAPVSGASIKLVWTEDLTSQQSAADADGIAAIDENRTGWAWIRVNAPGYRQASGVYEITQPDYTQEIILEAMPSYKQYLMAVEAGDSDDGENPIVLLESNDGLNWTKSAISTDVTGASPDVAWWNNAIYLLTGSIESSHLQYSPRMMRFDALTCSWSAAYNASIQADNACETSMGLYEYGYLTREACLFSDGQGELMMYGANWPNNSFLDLDLNASFESQKLKHFVSGIASAVNEYAGGLFHNTKDRYRLVLKGQPDAFEPDVFSGKDGWYMLLQRTEGIQLYYTADLNNDFTPAPGLQDGMLLTGDFGSACGIYDPVTDKYFIYAADAAGEAISSCEVKSLDSAIPPSELKLTIDKNIEGLENATFIGNPGICIIGSAQSAVVSEPIIIDNPDDILKLVATRQTELDNMGIQISTRTEDGKLTSMSIELTKDCLGLLADKAHPYQGIALQQAITLNNTVKGVGFCYNVVPYGIEQGGYTLYISKDAWTLEYLDFTRNVTNTLGFMGNKPGSYTVLASGQLSLTADETVLTIIYENGSHYLFANGALVGQYHEDLPLRVGGNAGAALISSINDTGKIDYMPIKMIALN